MKRQGSNYAQEVNAADDEARRSTGAPQTKRSPVSFLPSVPTCRAALDAGVIAEAEIYRVGAATRVNPPVGNDVAQYLFKIIDQVHRREVDHHLAVALYDRIARFDGAAAASIHEDIDTPPDATGTRRGPAPVSGNELPGQGTLPGIAANSRADAADGAAAVAAPMMGEAPARRRIRGDDDEAAGRGQPLTVTSSHAIAVIEHVDPRTLVVNEGLKAVAPRPPPAVLEAMQGSIRAHGVEAPLDVRREDRVVFDGHTRLELALRERSISVPVRFHDIPIDEELTDRTIRAAIERRQLTVWQLIRIGSRLVAGEIRRARARMMAGRTPTNPPDTCKEGSVVGEALEIVARRIGVGARQLREGLSVLRCDRNDLIEALDRDEIRIHTAYRKIRPPGPSATTSAAAPATPAHAPDATTALASSARRGTARRPRTRKSSATRPGGDHGEQALQEATSAAESAGAMAEAGGTALVSTTVAAPTTAAPTTAAEWLNLVMTVIVPFSGDGMEAVNAVPPGSSSYVGGWAPRDVAEMLEGVAAELRKIGIE